jgi:hypothetical protein
MSSAGFKPVIPAIKLLQTYALDGTAAGIGTHFRLDRREIVHEFN